MGFAIRDELEDELNEERKIERLKSTLGYHSATHRLVIVDYACECCRKLYSKYGTIPRLWEDDPIVLDDTCPECGIVSGTRIQITDFEDY